MTAYVWMSLFIEVQCNGYGWNNLHWNDRPTTPKSYSL